MAIWRADGACGVGRRKVTSIMTGAVLPAVGPDVDLVADLRATLGRMEHALGALSEAIVWTDGDGNVRWCNPAFARLARRPPLTLIGKPIEQVLLLTLFGEQLEPGQHPVRKVLSGSRLGATAMDSYETDRGGQARFLEIYTSCLRSASQTSAMMVVRDITERQLAERWLEAEGQRSELVRAVAAASNLAEDPQTALDAGLKLVRQFLGWPLGHAILIGQGPGGPPAHEHLWCHDTPDQAAFAPFVDRAASGSPAEQLCGVPKELVDGGSAVWIPDLALSPACARAAQATRAQLRSSVAFPV